jgi:glutamyl-tRNA synthetase
MSQRRTRVRFAPSPTGALHIGGIRTALFNYLLAKQQGGDFILRIEDTDRNRLVPGAEKYIEDALAWCGLKLDEGPTQGGDFGPYRQSDRLDIYRPMAMKLVETGWAYYAFDTAEELDQMREEAKSGIGAFQYGVSTRGQLNNSLTLTDDEVERRLAANDSYVIRFKMPEDEEVMVTDLIRGEVRFNTSDLDDKVLLKGDGWPTYHLANVVDDYLMQISHVIRGEEWLPSVGLHAMLYRAFGWEAAQPSFAHLPLILKPDGKGKLSKRDGAKFGFPVFPLDWKGATAEDSFVGFDGAGFDPSAVVNFLAMLGWNEGGDREIYSLEDLVKAFSVEKIHKSGARFDFDKAKWFNQQHIVLQDSGVLADRLEPILAEKSLQPNRHTLITFVDLFKERVQIMGDFWNKGSYCFQPVAEYDMVAWEAKWKPERAEVFTTLRAALAEQPTWATFDLEAATKGWMALNGLKAGEVMPILRIALCGSMQGPAVFDMMMFLGPDETDQRLAKAFSM